MTPAQLKAQLISRVHRLNEFLKMPETPDWIIDNERKFIERSYQHLKDIGIDAQQYLESDQGKTDYLMYAVDHDGRNAAIDRCTSCEHYEMIDLEIGRTDIQCELKVELFPDACRAFREAEDCDTRFQMMSLERCQNCHNAVMVKEFNDIEFPYCSKKLNRIKRDCLSFDPKEF